MSFISISPNMQLTIPNVSQEPGPDWANDVNNSLNLIDMHDHSNGYGVKITPAGLDISSSLSFQNNSAISVRSIDFLSQSGLITDLSAIYDVNGDLWYNDGFGNNIQITSGGGIVGTPGSISGLVPPASATYVGANNTFVWQAGANLPATMDSGTIIIRNLSVNSFGITLQAPTLTFDYSLTLPVIPGVQSFMTLDATGAMAAPWTVDNNTVKIISNQLVASVGQGEHNWEFNGDYPGLSPASDIDAIFFAPYDLTITSVWIYNGAQGASGTTEHDLLVASPGGAFTSILSTTGKITSVAAANIWTDSGSIVGAQAGVTKAVLLTPNILSGQAIRWDLLQSMASPATDARIRIWFKPA